MADIGRSLELSGDREISCVVGVQGVWSRQRYRCHLVLIYFMCGDSLFSYFFIISLLSIVFISVSCILDTTKAVGRGVRACERRCLGDRAGFG